VVDAKFRLDLAEDGGVNLTEGSIRDDGCSGMFGCQEGIVETFACSAVGKAAGIANKDDVVVEGIL
jgi:hypothetical protein